MFEKVLFKGMIPCDTLEEVREIMKELGSRYKETRKIEIKGKDISCYIVYF